MTEPRTEAGRRKSGIGRTLIDKAYAEGYRDGREAAAGPRLVRELAEELHVTGPLRDHHDPSDTTGWNVYGIETCRYPLCVAALGYTSTTVWAAAGPRDEAIELCGR